MVLFIFLFFSLAFPIQADIFQWLDTKGNKHFSDKPHKGAKVLQLDPGYSFYKVKKVYDGDTILLSNNQKIRLSGINSPEVESRYKLEEAIGEEAKLWLISKLTNKKIRLETDSEKQDRYKRYLAHVFTEDNQHINLELVKKGLASVNIHPPNLKYSEDLLKAQKLAESAILGIWKHPDYSPKPASHLKDFSLKGWQRIVGRIKSFHHSRKFSYLNFTDNFSLKIGHDFLKLFPDLKTYVGQTVEVRGWVNRNKKRYSMLIRHPSSIILGTVRVADF